METVSIPVNWVEDFLDMYESMSERENREQNLRKMMTDLHVILVKEMKKREEINSFVTIIDKVNVLCNIYPVVTEQALEYVLIDEDKAEIACKLRQRGVSHDDAKYVLTNGISNTLRSPGLKYKNVANVLSEIIDEYID